MKKEASGMNMLSYIAVLSVFLFSGAGSFMNAALQTMMDAWPGLSATTVRMISSVPPLVSLPVMLAVGSMVGKKISYRTCSILGTLLIAVGGVGPYFLHANWTIILVLRAVLGVGVGFIGMRNALVNAAVPPEKAAAFIGYGAVLYNLGNVLANPIVGILCQKGWQYSFLYDAIAFIPLLLIVLFLKEPEHKEAEAEEEKAGKREEGKIGWRIFYLCIMQFLSCCVLYPLLSGMATFIADKNLGSAAITGTILSVYTLAGAVCNFFLAPIMKMFKRFTISFLCLLVAGGELLIVFFPSVPVIFVGCALAGIGFGVVISVFQIYNGQSAPPSRAAFTSTLILAMLQLAIFASNYFIAGCHAVFQKATDAESAFIGGIIVYLAMAAASAVLPIAEGRAD